MAETAGEDRVPGQLAEVAAGELEDLRGDAVLLHEGLLGEVELEGVVGGERHVEPPGQVVRERRAVVVEEEGVVGEGRHGDPDLEHGVRFTSACHSGCTPPRTWSTLTSTKTSKRHETSCVYLKN